MKKKRRLLRNLLCFILIVGAVFFGSKSGDEADVSDKI